jgi:5-carboxymethyl-2-hydroxymuconate isomerase
MLNFCSIVAAILKMVTGRNFSMSGINSGHHNLPTYEMSLKSNNVEFVCGIVTAILKMATDRNFSISGINLGHHILPTYQMSLKSDNVEFVRYIGGHFENGDW